MKINPMRVVRKRACIFSHGIPEVSNTRCEQVESASNERFSRFCMLLLVESGMAKSVAEKLSHEKKELCHARHVRRTCLKEVAGLVRYEIPRRLTMRSKYELHAGENKVGCGAHP
jgi:hypothetical protein